MDNKNERDKLDNNETMVLSKKDFYKESFSDNTMVIPKIKEEEFQKKDKKDYDNERKDIFDKIEDKYNNLNNKRVDRNKKGYGKSKNKRQAFYRTTWFMWIMLFLLTPVGIILTWLNSSLKRKTKKRLTVLFAIYFVMLVGMPTIKSTVTDIKDKFNFTLPKKEEEVKPDDDSKINNEINKPEQDETNKNNDNSKIRNDQKKPNNKSKDAEKPKEDKNQNNGKNNQNNKDDKVKPEETKPETNKPSGDNSNNKPNTGNTKPNDNNNDGNKPPQEPTPKPSEGGNADKPKQP